MLIIGQNTEQTLTIPMKEYFSSFDVKKSEVVEITFGKNTSQVKRHWYAKDANKTTMTYNRVKNCFILKLTQQDTQKWKYQVPMQIRVKTIDGQVINSDIFYAYINPALSSEVL